MDSSKFGLVCVSSELMDATDVCTKCLCCPICLFFIDEHHQLAVGAFNVTKIRTLIRSFIVAIVSISIFITNDFYKHLL